MYVAEKRREIVDGGMELLVDPAKVRKCLSDDRHSLQRIKTWIEELMSAVIHVQTSKLDITGHILDHVEKSPMTRRDPLSGGDRHLWRVRLGKPLIDLLKRDLNLHYDPAPIARLEHGISQAVARHILTHSKPPSGGWTIDGLIYTVAGDLSTQNMRNARRRLRGDAVGLAIIGVWIEGDRARRVSQWPDGVSQRPGPVPQRPDGVP
ncbi:ABC transporter ATPase [Acidithiobacillus sp. M4-SHS-6]|uniref:ABC transporter ATPase n=1 Tax=Acidithiobacillus sp. M4-SHS-6 TaxID=3383024 RepID=UPI0039BECE83